MTNIIDFFIRYKVWTNVLFLSVFLFGMLSLSQIRYSFFPEAEPDFLTVQVIFPGASPEEVEEGIVLKIEENLEGIEGVDRVTSVSRENSAVVSVEIKRGENVNNVLADVKNAVDQINSFPRGAEKPVIFEQKFRTEAISMALYGDADLYNLKYIAEHLRDQILAVEGISQVKFGGLPNLEFSLELSEAKMRRYRLTFDDIGNAVAAANVNISGGKIDARDEEILIRSYGRKYFAKELQDIVVRANPDGTIIYLKDLATIRERWEDSPNRTYFNGQPAIMITVDQTKQEDIIHIADQTKKIMARFNEENENIRAEIFRDGTVVLEQRLSLLLRNGLFGLMLVVIALGFFLNLRLAFWVAIGIPFSFAGMFIIANLVGITINVLSLFGMILVVGILVDDAIVVAEHIYAHYEKGKSAWQAARLGAIEMQGPVVTSVLTTMIAFTPYFFLDGRMGNFIWQMSVVVISALAFSLIEAFFILPNHLNHSRGLHPHKEDSPSRKKIERGIHYLTHNLYGPLLRGALKHKWITIVMPMAMVIITAGLLGGGIIGVTIFPFIDGDTLPVNIELSAGRQEADVDSILAGIERKAWEVNEEMKAEREDKLDLVLGIRRDIGSAGFGASGSHVGSLTLILLPGEIREMDSFIIANRLRKKVGEIPGAQNVTFGRTSMFGKPVSLSLLGHDLKQLNRARDLVMEELARFSTLKDITDSNREGRRELNITLKPRAYALGFTQRDIAGQVRQGFFGQEIQRLQRGRDEIKVWARYRDEDRLSLGLLEDMRIRARDGGEYPFTELAEYKIQRGITTINHLNRFREIRIDASLSDESVDVPPILEKIESEVMPRVLSHVEGVQVSYEGQSRDQAKFGRSLGKAFPLALLAMLIMIMLVFRSYLQAFIIYSLIPLGVLGAIWGHGIHGIQLNTLTMFGVIALTGIIINDSIVFVDQINRFLREGQKVTDAVYNAGIARLRPILLTSVTTSLGLGPLILETSRQAQFLIPMAIAIAYGLIFGTLILLLVLPALFLVVNKFRFWFAVYIQNRDVTFESIEPAVKEVADLRRQV